MVNVNVSGGALDAVITFSDISFHEVFWTVSTLYQASVCHRHLKDILKFGSCQKSYIMQHLFP